ncbi:MULTISPECIES: GH1 family beta-glucosidase [unclassified Modestobacter]|uniref:GH1 family beta-glucosidase n=1 Tax=unclassified Modestobacter TaxID=2643866 RepID=UPI0022AA085B|nr:MULTISPECIES: GH1 family beta-glucosidase [unclassified Modestobacter]MCZ2825486.1 GH1 family beta-glucosidase [Modestobacter sp. VKM Ac-2981]MCZ2853449.1 GH1 family beta-glucosidase [Modestobacter sp. VKM Ac-2982]
MTSTDVRPQTAAGLTFPPGFVFGAATAAYQIEGAVDVDGRGPSIWDTFSHTPGKTFQGDTGDVAVEHYVRYPADVALMKDLGLDAYRFSVSWSRVLPTGAGAIEQRGLDFYRRLVDELLGAGIAPWLTLYHWDLPQGLQDRGGWTNRDTALRFADYAGIVYDALGDRVPHWSTLNEPMCSSLLGHMAGQHAPGHQDPVEASRAVHHLLLGHGLATQVMRDKGADHLGITLNFTPMSPATDSAADVDAARRLDGQQNRMFLVPIATGEYPADVVADLADAGAPLPIEDGDLEVISTPLDWLGVNYYFESTVRGLSEPSGKHPTFIGAERVQDLEPEGPTTTMGWGISPEAFTALLTRISGIAPGLPLFITENGSAWPDEVSADGQVHDPERVDYLLRHLAAMTEAIEAGADVRGYFAWSLLDNYEWARGYAQRFGLVHVDYDTQVRTPKDSARTYAEVIRNAKDGV